VHYTLWDSIFLHNVRKNISKSYFKFNDFYKYLYANYVNIGDPIYIVHTGSNFTDKCWTEDGLGRDRNM